MKPPKTHYFKTLLNSLLWLLGIIISIFIAMWIGIAFVWQLITKIQPESDIALYLSMGLIGSICSIIVISSGYHLSHRQIKGAYGAG